MKDGKCWMTQNLDLDLSTKKELTSIDTDVPEEASYTPEYDTATAVTADTILANNTGQRSWSLGNVRITNPDASNGCGSGKNSAADCTNQFTSYTTPTSANGDVNAHYILGNHYQWNVATAGTGGSITSGMATNSICPKGWKLPTSGNDNGTYLGDTAALVAALGGNLVSDILKAPFYGVRGGNVVQNTTDLFKFAGAEGYYWSATSYTNTNAYSLAIYGNSFGSADGNARNRGRTVRCIAR